MLGPLLFSIYVNDNSISGQQFADDLRMFCVIRDAANFYQLQEDINNLVAWANK